MPMNLEAVGAVSEPGERSWDSDAALRYALGVGAGQLDPTGFELEFTAVAVECLTMACESTLLALPKKFVSPL